MYRYILAICHKCVCPRKAPRKGCRHRILGMGPVPKPSRGQWPQTPGLAGVPGAGL